MDEADVLTFKVIRKDNGEVRLVVWENDQVKEIFEATPRKIRTRARKMLDEAVGIIA
jgi:hypothetical protein